MTEDINLTNTNDVEVNESPVEDSSNVNDLPRRFSDIGLRILRKSVFYSMIFLTGIYVGSSSKHIPYLPKDKTHEGCISSDSIEGIVPREISEGNGGLVFRINGENHLLTYGLKNEPRFLPYEYFMGPEQSQKKKVNRSVLRAYGPRKSE